MIWEFKDIIIITVIIFGGLLATGYTVYQYVDGKKKDYENLKANNNVLEKAYELQEVQKTNIKKSDEVIEAQKDAQQKSNLLIKANREINDKASDLIKVQNELNRLQGETLKNVLGDGFAAIIITTKKDGSPYCYIKNYQSYNIYDLHISITNYSSLIKANYKKENEVYYFSSKDFEKSTKHETMRLLNAGQYAELPIHFDRKNGRTLFMIKISSRHNTTVQYSIFDFSLTEKNSKHHFKIFDVDRGTQVYKILFDKSNGIEGEEVWNEFFPYKKVMVVNPD